MAAVAPSFDPANTDDVRERLIAALHDRFPGITVAEGPDRYSGGMDTYVYAVRFAGPLSPEWAAPLVLRVFPNLGQAAKAEHEAAMQKFVSGLSFPAPRPLLTEPEGDAFGLPFMIMERATGSPAIESFTNPLNLPSLIRRMTALQARLHSLPTEGCPVACTEPLVDRWLKEPREQIARYDPPGLADLLAWIEEKAPIVRDEQPALIHLDFHPMNILVDGEHMTLLDWSDGTLGDRHADVARTTALLWLAAPLLANPVERTIVGVLRHYIVPAYKREYRKLLPLDEERLCFWEAFLAFRSWTQVAVIKQEGEGALGARAGVAAELPDSLLPAFDRYVAERIKRLG